MVRVERGNATRLKNDNLFFVSDICQLGPRHQLQPGQPDPGCGSDSEQSSACRFSRRFHSSHQGTFSGHDRIRICSRNGGPERGILVSIL